ARLARSLGLAVMAFSFSSRQLVLGMQLSGLQLAQIALEAVEALVPEAAIMLDPVGDLLQRARLQPAGPPLRLAAARDQAGALQHLEMLRDAGKAHVEGLGELGHRGLAQSEPCQDGAPRRIGEGREGGVE